VRRALLARATLTMLASVVSAAPQAPPSRDALLLKATTYVTAYEQAFSLLVSEEHYTQEVRQPTNAGSNLSRTNPGGGIGGGHVPKRRVLKSDYLLVHLGPGAGWMPFRDVFEVDGSKVRDREDRLAKLFLANDASRFDLADRIMADSTRHNLGSVTRTINIPTLGMMLLHPRVRDRFTFDDDGDDVVEGVKTRRVEYRETARPTLIKTTRGRDLALTGTLWIEPASGAVVKSLLVAADPALRATMTVLFKRDEPLGIWVPAQMEEIYNDSNSRDEIVASATYRNFRRFQVNTNEKLGKPPGGLR
jgi:hypothetical protein